MGKAWWGAAAVAVWAAAPWVAMARRGTVDQVTSAAWAGVEAPGPVWPTGELPRPRRSPEGIDLRRVG